MVPRRRILYHGAFMSAAVGADIESLCSKCGDVWHVVVAKDEHGRIARVQCKQCGGYHRLKSPGGNKAPARKAPSAPRTPRSESKPVERFETPAVAADLTRPTRTYKVSERFAVGDRVEHPTFGTGVVESASEPGKMTVFFAAGRKVLVHDKGDTPRLEKPRPFDHTTPSPDRLPPGATPTADDDT